MRSWTSPPLTKKPFAVSRWPLTETMPGFRPPDGFTGPVTPAMMTLLDWMVVVGMTPG